MQNLGVVRRITRPRARVAQQVPAVYDLNAGRMSPRAEDPATLPARAGSSHTCVMHSSVTLTLNGESRVFQGQADGPLSVTGLLVTLGLDCPQGGGGAE